MRINLPELIEEEVITKQVADQVSDFYSRKKEKGVNKLFVIFGVLGALKSLFEPLLPIGHSFYPTFTNLNSDYYEFVFPSLEIIYPQRAMAKEFADQNSVWDPNPVFYCFVPGSWFKYCENIKANGRGSCRTV